MPLGIDLVRGLWRAHADQRIMSFLQSFIDEMGPNLELRILGNAGLVTTDPENVKAILSKSKFREGEIGDFCLESLGTTIAQDELIPDRLRLWSAA